MSAWRREFLLRFPENKRQVESAQGLSELMHDIAFVLLKNAVNAGDTAVVDRLISYCIWLAVNSGPEFDAVLEEDLFVRIAESTRLRRCLLQMLSPQQYKMIKHLFIENWQDVRERESFMQKLDREFAELNDKGLT